MARTAVTPQALTRDGITPNFTTAIADGHMFSNNGRVIARIKNTGSEATVTFAFGGSKDGTPIEGGRDVVVPATTGDVTTAVWPNDDYNQSDGTVHVDYSSPTGVSIAFLYV